MSHGHEGTVDDDVVAMLENDESLKELVRAARLPGNVAELSGSDDAVRMFTETFAPHDELRGRRLGKRAAAVLAGAGMLFTLSGVAAASQGGLPGPLQSFAHRSLAVVGVHVPDTTGTTTTIPSNPNTNGWLNSPDASAPGQMSGPGATAPGVSLQPQSTAPGQARDPSGTAPGQAGDPSGTAPGQAGDPTGSTPGQSGQPPKNSNPPASKPSSDKSK